MQMKIEKPEKQDLEAVWKFIGMLNTASYELNPLKPMEDGDFHPLEDGDKSDVLDGIITAYEDSGLQWLMSVLETLLSPANGIINQEAEYLEFHPRLNAYLALQGGKES